MTDHKHYFRDVSDLDQIDVYRVLDLFEVTCPVAQHVIKKAMAAGRRGHKTTRRDWTDIADSAKRKIEMIDEDSGWTKRAIHASAFQQPVSATDELLESDTAAEDEAWHAVEALQKPYTGHGGVMTRCPDCDPESCPCVAA